MRSVLIALLSMSLLIALFGCGEAGDPTAQGAEGSGEARDEVSAPRASSDDSQRPMDDPQGASDAEDPLVDAVVAAVLEDSEESISEEPIRCYAEKMVATLGRDRLHAAGVVGEDLYRSPFDYSKASISDAEADEVYAHLEGCGINMRDLMVTSLIDGAGSEGARRCIESSIDEDLARRLTVETMTIGEAGARDEGSATFDLANAIERCSQAE